MHTKLTLPKLIIFIYLIQPIHVPKRRKVPWIRAHGTPVLPDVTRRPRRRWRRRGIIATRSRSSIARCIVPVCERMAQARKYRQVQGLLVVRRRLAVHDVAAAKRVRRADHLDRAREYQSSGIREEWWIHFFFFSFGVSIGFKNEYYDDKKK